MECVLRLHLMNVNLILMKTILITITLLIGSMSLFAQGPLPKEWEKDFVVSVSHTGSMSGYTMHLKFSYDSCELKESSNRDKPVHKKFAMTQADRGTILKKLQELKVDNIKSDRILAVQNDGWSDTLCFGLHCIEGGSASEMTEAHKNSFLDATRFLKEFANKHKRK